MSYDRPYGGLRVVDLSQGIAGPYCAMLLARHGADVIKVEPPEGDWARVLGRRYGDHTAFSIVGNLGKRSIVLDLKQSGDRKILERLVDGADVFLEGFRPGVISRLGCDYAAVSVRNPSIIYVSVSGFGQTGPLSSKPAMDPVLQAFTGFMNENRGQDGIPHRANPVIVDMSTALYTHQAVAAALYARRDDRRGRYIDSSLMAAAANLQAVRMMATVMEGGPMKAATAPSGVFRTADGWMQIVVLKDRDFRNFCAAAELPEVGSDPRNATVVERGVRADDLNAEVAGRIARETSGHWREVLTAAGIQNEVLQDYPTFVGHPQTQATGLISWLDQPGSDHPWPLPNPAGTLPMVSGEAVATAPMLGEHGAEILEELGVPPAALPSAAE